MIPPLRWIDEEERVDLLDQTRLPVEETWLDIRTTEQMAEAIRMLRVRGAPAIGIAAAYGVVLSLRKPSVDRSDQVDGAGTSGDGSKASGAAGDGSKAKGAAGDGSRANGATSKNSLVGGAGASGEGGPIYGAGASAEGGESDGAGVASTANSAATDVSPQRSAMDAIEQLKKTRPTAVNLFYTLGRMARTVEAHPDADAGTLKKRLLQEAHAIFQEDLEAGKRLGENGLTLLRSGMTVLTHCHTGGVATSGYGTALAPLILAPEKGVTLSAYVDETRPLLQGSRITAWELGKSGVPATLITDSMAGHVMREGRIDAVIVGADRIAANGDVANKIGTYTLAVLARAHDIPFYVSAPVSTIDLDTPTGGDIIIEERESREVTHGFGRQTAPDGVTVYNPAFDVTPAEFVTAIITERGVVRPPYETRLAELLMPAGA